MEQADLEEFRVMLLGRARSLKFLWDWPYQIEVEDVAAATILTASQKLDQFRGSTKGELGNWLLTILHRQAIDELRKHDTQKRDHGRLYSFEDFLSSSDAGLERLLIAEISTPSVKLQREEQIHAAYAAIELLPERQRSALLARFIGQWSLDRIVEEMNHSTECEPVTKKAVTSLIERALRKLRDVLEHLK